MRSRLQNSLAEETEPFFPGPTEYIYFHGPTTPPRGNKHAVVYAKELLSADTILRLCYLLCVFRSCYDVLTCTNSRTFNSREGKKNLSEY